MKVNMLSNAKKYITLFCGCVITVTLASAVVINSREKNNINFNSTKTSYTNYSFSNVYTYDEVPKYIAMVPELTVNAKEEKVKEKEEQNKIALEEKEKIKKEEQAKLEQEKKEKQNELEKQKLEEKAKEEKQQEEQISNIVYDNMTLEQLTEKLNKSLNSTMAGQGTIFASYSLEKGVDPYIATAIMLHETGCKWNCSELVKKCNNVGGVKGGPTCGSGSYKSYDTLEAGIKGYIDNLSNGYFAQGLNTPELIVKKYTGFNNTNWLEKVNKYIDSIKAQ